METVTFTLPTIEQVNFIIEALDEHIPVRGNAVATDNPEEDKETEDKIIADLDNGNIWAWCTVMVTAEYKGVEGTDYLGCCSYDSEEKFKEDGYFEAMKRSAYNELISNLKVLND